jgi:hypothetical protein
MEQARRKALTTLQGVAIEVGDTGTRVLSCNRGWGPSCQPAEFEAVVTVPLVLETLDSLPSPRSLEEVETFINKVVITQRSGSLTFAEVAQRIGACGAVALVILNSRPPSAAATGRMTGVDFRPCRGLYEGNMPVIGVGQEDAIHLTTVTSVRLSVGTAVDPLTVAEIVREFPEDAEICRVAMRCVHHESLALVAQGDGETGMQLADAIILAMARNPNDAIIAEYGCFNLGSLAFNALIGESAMEATSVVARAMEAHRETERVAAWGCRALTHIAMGGAETKPFGGHLRAKDAQDEYPGSRDVQEWGAKVVRMDGKVSASRDGLSSSRGRRQRPTSSTSNSDWLRST